MCLLLKGPLNIQSEIRLQLDSNNSQIKLNYVPMSYVPLLSHEFLSISYLTSKSQYLSESYLSMVII